MAEFEVLGTDREIDTSDPTGSLMTLVSLIVGAGFLFMILPIGRQLGNWVNGQLAQLTNSSVGDNSPGMTFGSAD